jgi:hypothetical protein
VAGSRQRAAGHFFLHGKPMRSKKGTAGRLGIGGFAVVVFQAVLFGFTPAPIFAQSVQTLPEVDVHLTVNSYVRTYFQAKDDRDAGATDQLAIGPSVQFYLKPLVKLKRVSTFDLDDSKTRAIVLETGYRYVAAPGVAPFNRMETILTVNFPLKYGLRMSDRNRADLDWKDTGFTWRYRNRLWLERTFAIHSYHFIPYVAVEPYYVDQFHKWSTTALFAGSLFPIGKHVQFNFYYEHENNTGKKPNSQQDSIGLVLNLHFSLEKKK